MTFKFETQIWKETANSENPFQADSCFCFGYDVFQDLLPNAKWADYFLLLITGQRPDANTATLFEKISIVLMNPGIRDLSVRAAMNAGVGKAPAGSVLVSALSASAGQFGGAREISLSMDIWQKNIQQSNWDLSVLEDEEQGIWPKLEHTPGFDPHSHIISKTTLVCLQKLSEISTGQFLPWLMTNHISLSQQAQSPISLVGVIAAAFQDLGLNNQQAEYLFLILRLPGAAAHAMEQQASGWRKFPFFADSVSPAQPLKDTQLPDIEELVKGYLNESE